MLLEVTVNNRGQITLPSVLRKALDIQDNSKLILQKIQGNLVIRTSLQNRKKRHINELAFGLGKINKDNADVDKLIKNVKYKKARVSYGR